MSEQTRTTLRGAINQIAPVIDFGELLGRQRTLNAPTNVTDAQTSFTARPPARPPRRRCDGPRTHRRGKRHPPYRDRIDPQQKPPAVNILEFEMNELSISSRTKEISLRNVISFRSEI
ncbi:hypothetical protein HG717_36125 (plasmid) [Rhodococcus erythropolis]|uniref:hypothetical protein n=1 Tax=Rhodococcus erythropolis TaxID=1833 RepID=UPI001C9B6F9C|nr:hypothetical protein [Rhodococcus erythropolis]MBY6389293.1 hypothetical protein [Rhodococcus erythropolis]